MIWTTVWAENQRFPSLSWGGFKPKATPKAPKWQKPEFEQVSRKFSHIETMLSLKVVFMLLII